MGRLARLAWASPTSLVGILLLPFFRKRWVTRGIILAEGASWPRRLGWKYRAITFGHIVLALEELDEKTLAHELEHVRQYEKAGILYVPLYLLASLRAVLKGGHYYRDNSFEVAARRAAGSAGRRA
ncbi:MAG: hypothetical protein GEU78_12905 [Actinobacteria bacterium]|nr:hypothetical protein [Actinomycetota bacterium]